MKTLAQRFWTKFNIGAPNDCWEWTASFRSDGYGQININKKNTPAHRLAYELTNGPLGDKHACHSCDNKKCCNPTHLFSGTHRDNMLDMVRKGKHPRYQWADKSEHPAALIDNQIAHEIRFGALCGCTHRALADLYGIDRSGVSRIIRGEIWSSFERKANRE